MGQYLGDFAEDAIIRGDFNTRAKATGAPITLDGTPSLAVYKDGSVSETAAGVTLTVDFDGVTGSHLFAIDTSADAFYTTGSDYRIKIAAGTVDGESVVGVTVGRFSIENRFIRSEPPTTADILAAASSNAATPPLERNIGDTNPVTFQWITDDATITAQRSINNAAYENVSGAIAFLRTDGTKHLYTLAYNEADRPPTNGTVRYAFTDGTYTRYLSLRISGANVVTPDNAAIANAAASALSTDNKLSSGRLSRIDRLPDVNSGAAGGLSLVGSEMTLDSATLTALFADADVAGLIASITALFDNADDVPIQTIAAQASASTVAAMLANPSIITLLADAAASKVAAQSADGKINSLITNTPPEVF